MYPSPLDDYRPFHHCFFFFLLLCAPYSCRLISDNSFAKSRPPHWQHSLSSSLSLASHIIRSINMAAMRFSSLLLQHAVLRYYLAAYVVALHLLVMAVIIAGLVT